MSHFQYSVPSGTSQKLSDQYHYSQAVRSPGSPAIVKISGQGGWDPETGVVDPTNIQAQVDQAFANVELVLKNAGLRGWEDVYLARAFLIREEGIVQAVGDALRKWCPNHRPVLTAVGTPWLALEEMRIEIEVEAMERSAGK